MSVAPAVKLTFAPSEASFSPIPVTPSNALSAPLLAANPTSTPELFKATKFPL